MKDYIIWFLSYVFAILMGIGTTAMLFTWFMVPVFVWWSIVSFIGWILCFMYVTKRIL